LNRSVKAISIIGGLSLLMLVGAYGAQNASGPTDEQLSADIQELDK